MSKDNNTRRMNTPWSQYIKSLNVLTIRKTKFKQVELLEVTLEIQNDHRPFQPLASDPASDCLPADPHLQSNFDNGVGVKG